MNISPDAYSDFRDYLLHLTGIDLGENKDYLVSTRLKEIYSKTGHSELSEFTRFMKISATRDQRQLLIDVMTTNETSWFRDVYPFEYMENVVFPKYAAAGKRLRIWCAASSSGQEPYSLSILAEEYKAKKGNINVEIVATDLSSRILEKAKLGEFNHLAIGRGLSDSRLKKYFTNTRGDIWALSDQVKKNVRFSAQNLLDSFSALGKFDIVFCRNVLIYFPRETKSDILLRMHQQLNEEKLLFLGASENLADAEKKYSMIQCRPGVVFQGK